MCEGAVKRLLPAGNQSCEPRPQAQHPAGLWNEIFTVHKAAAKYEESNLTKQAPPAETGAGAQALLQHWTEKKGRGERETQ